MAKSDGMETSQTIWTEGDEILADGNLRAVFERIDLNNDDGLDHFEVSILFSTHRKSKRVLIKIKLLVL